MPWSRKSRAITLLLLWAGGHIQSLCLYKGALYFDLYDIYNTKPNQV